MLLTRHALASSTAACAGRVAQLVRALVSHTRGPGFESLRDHSSSQLSPFESDHVTREMQQLLKRTLFVITAFCALASAATAQQNPRPTAQQTRAMLQARPELILQLRQKL